MNRPPILSAALSLIAVLCPIAAAPGLADSHDEAPRVALETSKGRIVLELDRAKAPITVASFLEDVAAGFYEGTIFHRVIPNFMVQGGGFDRDLNLRPTDKSLRNEADNGLKNLRGTVAMARKPDPHSASVQFFVNLVDNGFLDHRDTSVRGWGYTVFGWVVEGMDVVDAIAGVPTTTRGGNQNVPVEPVVITKASVVDPSG